MASLMAKIIMISLLFVSAEAAICGTYHLFDSDDIFHVDDDNHDEHEDIFCSHICHCAHHHVITNTDAITGGSWIGPETLNGSRASSKTTQGDIEEAKFLPKNGPRGTYSHF